MKTVCYVYGMLIRVAGIFTRIMNKIIVLYSYILYIYYRATSKSLKQTVSCITEARNTHSALLLGGDYSGKVAMWYDL